MTVVDGITPAEYFRHHVEKEGGVDAILESMPKPATKASGENRRRRFENLLSGKEFAVESVLGGRKRQDTGRRCLRAKASTGSPAWARFRIL